MIRFPVLKRYKSGTLTLEKNLSTPKDASSSAILVTAFSNRSSYSAQNVNDRKERQLDVIFLTSFLRHFSYILTKFERGLMVLYEHHAIGAEPNLGLDF